VWLDVLRHEFEVNVFGRIAITQAFLPPIRQARGRIVNIGSVDAYITMPFACVLAGYKSALNALNDTLRLELHPFGIHVCIIEPASIHTPAINKTLGQIEKVVEGLPREGAARYGAMLRGFARWTHAREQKGSPPEVVASAVHRALTEKRPRIRYRVGKDAWLLTTLPRFVPERALDYLRLRLFGLRHRFGQLHNTHGVDYDAYT
jgi:NAD(P)-dependent dehydrogenase (short-subunit alcohol dehydrogenase family)